MAREPFPSLSLLSSLRPPLSLLIFWVLLLSFLWLFWLFSAELLLAERRPLADLRHQYESSELDSLAECQADLVLHSATPAAHRITVCLPLRSCSSLLPLVRKASNMSCLPRAIAESMMSAVSLRSRW